MSLDLYIRSHHSMRLDNWTPKKSIAWNVAKEWEDDYNAPVLEEILDEIKKHKELDKKIKKQDNE